jgi:hypothetical protein
VFRNVLKMGTSSKIPVIFYTTLTLLVLLMHSSAVVSEIHNNINISSELSNNNLDFEQGTILNKNVSFLFKGMKFQ